MYRFLITASILVLLGFIYLGSRLIVPSLPLAARVTLWLILGGKIANLLWLPFKRWQRQSGTLLTGRATRLLEASAYNLMGFLSLLLLFTALSEFARLALRTAPEAWTTSLALALPKSLNLEATFALAIATLSLFFFFWGRITVAIGPRYRFVKIVFPLPGKKRRRPRFRKHKHATRRIRIPSPPPAIRRSAP